MPGWKSARRFLYDTSGATALVFSLSLIAVLGFAGIAIDLRRAGEARSRVQISLDAAALAGAKNFAQIRDVKSAMAAARGMFESSIGDSQDYKGFTVAVNSTTGLVTASAQYSIVTTLTRVLGTERVAANLTAQASYGAPAGLTMDVGVMLDVSGSMAGSKFDALKAGVRGMLGDLIGAGATSATMRFAFSPFSSSVNAGAYADALVGAASANKCVGDRVGVAAFTDAPPAADFFNVTGAKVISDDSISSYETRSFKGYGSPYFDVSTVCPAARLFPLTGSYAQLSAQLDSYAVGGITAGQTGMQFAWYLISDKWRGFWPAANAPALKSDARKIVVLMTDGEFNAYFHDANGLPNDQGQQLCNAMKAQGVTIFSISYDFDGDSESMLRSCASKPEYFYGPNSTAELIAAFKGIAAQMKGLGDAGALRLVR